MRCSKFLSGTWRGEGFTRYEGMGPKIDQGGVLEGSWWVLGVFWRPTPKNEVRIRFFRSSWDRLGLVLGAVLGLSWAFWGGSGVQDGIKIEKKII